MNIFVANLNFKLQEDELLDLFENFGEVSSAKIIIDRETGRSKGFGFVEMDNDDEANSAIADLNGQEVHGREMVVKQAEERPRRERRF
jgi:RNA recognition motif-containing protein